MYTDLTFTQANLDQKGLQHRSGDEYDTNPATTIQKRLVRSTASGVSLRNHWSRMESMGQAACDYDCLKCGTVAPVWRSMPVALQ